MCSHGRQVVFRADSSPIYAFWLLSMFFAGRSYGGACCNALLKVLYDAANEVADAAQTQAASEALFEDDDDESLQNAVDLDRNSTFASLDMNDHYNPSTISWAMLLRKMKAEMKGLLGNKKKYSLYSAE